MGHDPRRALRTRGLRARRALSQNFLKAPHVAERMAEVVARTGHRLVVELGPGTGALTRPLLARGLRVVALERDPRMIELLREELEEAVARGDLELVAGDAARTDLGALLQARGVAEAPLVGNLPYAVTGAILRRIVEAADRLPSATIMVQREVADRLLAAPGSKAYGAPSVFVGARFAPDRLLQVPPGAFHPPPKVWSAVVHLRRLDPPRATVDEAFERVVRAAFGQRRKTLRRALAALRDVEAGALLDAAGVDGALRGETLSVEQFERLAAALRAAATPR